MSESPEATSESAGEGVAQTVSGCRVVVSVAASRVPYASESAWEGVAQTVSGCRGAALVTQSQTYGIGPEGGGQLVFGRHEGVPPHGVQHSCTGGRLGSR